MAFLPLLFWVPYIWGIPIQGAKIHIWVSCKFAFVTLSFKWLRGVDVPKYMVFFCEFGKLNLVIFFNT